MKEFIKKNIKVCFHPSLTYSKIRKFILIHYDNYCCKTFDYKQIQNKIFSKIKTYDFISFDIFDTLLVRPCIEPSDILYLLSNEIFKKYGIDIFEARIRAENSLKNENASILDIYNFLGKIYELEPDMVDQLMQLELDLEYQLLQCRTDIKSIYDAIVRSGKKVICISDMYLPSDFLTKVLMKNGYTSIEKVYISNEYSARKSDGSLFSKVCEDLKTTKLLHIGDDFMSDYIMSQKKGIKSVYIPKISKIVTYNHKNFAEALLRIKKSSPANRILFGSMLLYAWNKSKNYAFNRKNPFEGLEDISDFFLSPFLVFLSLKIITNINIKLSYSSIYFAARDGYLPQKIYNILNSDGSALQSKYIYASRIAYWTGLYRNYADLLIGQYNDLKYGHTFNDFLNTYAPNWDFSSYYTSKQLETEINNNLYYCIELISKNKSIFADLYEKKA